MPNCCFPIPLQHCIERRNKHNLYLIYPQINVNFEYAFSTVTAHRMLTLRSNACWPWGLLLFTTNNRSALFRRLSERKILHFVSIHDSVWVRHPKREVVKEKKLNWNWLSERGMCSNFSFHCQFFKCFFLFNWKQVTFQYSSGLSRISKFGAHSKWMFYLNCMIPFLVIILLFIREPKII